MIPTIAITLASLAFLLAVVSKQGSIRFNGGLAIGYVLVIGAIGWTVFGPGEFSLTPIAAGGFLVFGIVAGRKTVKPKMEQPETDTARSDDEADPAPAHSATRPISGRPSVVPPRSTRVNRAGPRRATPSTGS